MSNKFEFILENNNYSKLIFKFDYKNTHVHSFNEELPKDWKEVYKVYYSWKIYRKYEYDDEKYTQTLLNLSCDECSIIPDLSTIIKRVIETGEVFNYPTLGQPAGDWIINKKTYKDFDNTEKSYIEFQVFNNVSGQGIRWSMNIDNSLNFCNYLDSINDYALKHGEPI